MTTCIAAFRFLLVAYIISENRAQKITEIEPVSCQKQCFEACEPCLAPTNCTEDQIQCGVEQKCKSMFSTPHEICIPDTCECPRHEGCSTYCPMECGKEALRCPGQLDENDCQEPDQCVPKPPGCPGYCPVECNAKHVQCPALDCKECEEAPYCLPIEVGINGADCDTHCPKICCGEELHHCPGGVNANGCKEDDICVAVQKGCKGVCPVYKDDCTEGEMFCPGPTCDGCKEAAECRPAAINVNGEECAPTSASHECPICCEESEYLCPGVEDHLGCKTENLCLEKTIGHNNETCGMESVCPCHCPPTEVCCEAGFLKNGCKKPGICVPEFISPIDGEHCTVHCPIECGENEIKCEGPFNSLGCPGEEFCKPKVPVLGEEECYCEAFCPLQCKHGEIKCPEQLDCRGCPTEEVCVTASKSVDGEMCPDTSASHHCPKICNEEEGEALCSAGDDPNYPGCKGESLCMPKHLKPGSDPLNKDYCPSVSTCPMHCGANALVCPNGYDLDGCKAEDICVAIGTMWDGITACDTECPPICLEDEVFCPGGLMCNGCTAPSSCQQKVTGVDGAYCLTVCPIYCTPEQFYVAGESDENGCPTAGYCANHKIVGDSWKNEGGCEGNPGNLDCGPGTQAQTRDCTDGTIDTCTAEDTSRVVSCKIAGTALPACKAPTGGDCIEVDGKYTPLDMPGEKRTVTDSASACQDRCLNTEGCSYFSWWNDGGCHLQDSSAKLTSGVGANVHYGPKSCSADNSTTTTTTTSIDTTSTDTTSTDTTSTETTDTTATTTTDTTTSTSTDTVAGCNSDTWPDINKGVICGDCLALIKIKSYGTCGKYCESLGLACLNAYEEVSNTCTIESTHGCDADLSFTSDALCECTADTGSTAKDTSVDATATAKDAGTVTTSIVVDTGAKDAATTHDTTVKTTTAAKDSTMDTTATTTVDAGVKSTASTDTTTTMGGHSTTTTAKDSTMDTTATATVDAGAKTTATTDTTTTMGGHSGGVYGRSIAEAGVETIAAEAGAETTAAEAGEEGIASRIARLLEGLLATEGH